MRMMSTLQLLWLTSLLLSSTVTAFVPSHRKKLIWSTTTPSSIPLLRMASRLTEEETNRLSLLQDNVLPVVPTTTTTTTTMTMTAQPVDDQISTFDNALAAINQDENNDNDDSNQEYQRGLITIGSITLLFASNSPALHAAFSETSAPPVLLVNAAISVVALVGLLFGGSTLESNTPLPSSLNQNKDDTNTKNDPDNDTDTTAPLQAGLELGLWKFLGTTANLAGLSLTTADHGAFLIQLTTLIVPVVQGVMGVPIPRRIQFALLLALSGVYMFTQDMTGSATGAASPLGDALCVVAAVFYATYDLRLFHWGKRVPPRQLITGKIATQAMFSILLLAVCGSQEAMDFVQQQSSSPSPRMEVLIPVILWSGIAVNAIAPYLQVGGQQAVGPTRCQTIYASQPLWASIMSYFFLGETVGAQGFVGACAFLMALFLAATSDAPDPNCGKETCEV